MLGYPQWTSLVPQEVQGMVILAWHIDRYLLAPAGVLGDYVCSRNLREKDQLPPPKMAGSATQSHQCSTLGEALVYLV